MDVVGDVVDGVAEDINCCLMNVDDRMGSCRDKGRMWGRVGAWCLSWWQRAPLGTAWSTKVAPQPGQAPGPLIHSTPPLVPTGPWAASTSMARIPRFGRQYSLGVHLAHPHTLNKQLPYELCGGWNMLMMFPAGSLIVKARPKGSSVGWLTISTPLETNVA